MEVAFTNFNVVRDVVRWIRDHPEHLENEDDAVGTPANIWLRYCAGGLIINEYEDPVNQLMLQERVVGGCDLIFNSGQLSRRFCQSPIH